MGLRLGFQDGVFAGWGLGAKEAFCFVLSVFFCWQACPFVVVNSCSQHPRGDALIRDFSGTCKELRVCD